MPNSDSLSPEEKLETLRELDIFHHWDSIDERRLCRRCGQIISGREIKVSDSRHNPRGVRLECPTEGCPSVPFEWLMLEPATEIASQQPLETLQPEGTFFIGTGANIFEPNESIDCGNGPTATACWF